MGDLSFATEDFLMVPDDTHCQILAEILPLLKLRERSEHVNISQLFRLFLVKSDSV